MCKCLLEAQSSINIPWRCHCTHTFSADVALISSPLFRPALKWAQKLKNAKYHPCTSSLGPVGNGTRPPPTCQSIYSSQKRKETLFKERAGRSSLTDLPPCLPEEWRKVRMGKIPSRDKPQILEMGLFAE